MTPSSSFSTKSIKGIWTGSEDPLPYEGSLDHNNISSEDPSQGEWHSKRIQFPFTDLV
jgi:hypothetical protein